MKPDLKLVEDTGSQLEVDVFDPPPQQAEMPFAVVDGEPITQLPKDLYIPPDALQVFLEAFEGPLDLLLYLIRRQNLDVLDIPIAEITRQYMHYIDVMQELQLELAGEYLLMAAMLAEIKSRMLLPQLSASGEEEEDPRAELVRRLQEYERFKKAAEDLDRLPRMERDTMAANVEIVERKVVRVQPEVSLREMLLAFKDVLSRADLFAHHHISREQLSVRQRMSDILDRLRESAFIEFVRLFDPAEGRMGVTVTFIAVLELMKEGLLEIVQAEPYAPIHIRPASGRRHLSVVGEVDANADVDAENVAALAQPAHPDENDDPDDDAPLAEVVTHAAPPQASGEAPAGEQASAQVEEPAVAQSQAAQGGVQAVEVAAVSNDAAAEQVVAQVGAEVTTPAAEHAAHAAAVPESSQQPVVPDDPSQADAAEPIVAGVAAEIVRVATDVDALASEQIAALPREGGAVELAAEQLATSPATSLAASDPDGSDGFEEQLVVLEAAEYAATFAAFEHTEGTTPAHVDAGFIQGFAGPVPEMVALASGLSHELAAGTLPSEPPSFAQLPGDTISASQHLELTDFVSATLESEPAALHPLVARRIEAQGSEGLISEGVVSEGYEAAMGTSPADPVAEAAPSMAAELEVESVLEQQSAPAQTDTEVELPALAMTAFDAVGGEVSAELDLAGGGGTDMGLAATSQLEPWIAIDAAESPQAALQDVELRAPPDELGSEVSDGVLSAEELVEPAPEQVDAPWRAEADFAPELAGAALDTAAQTSPASVAFEADADPVVATPDLVPDAVAGAQQSAVADVDPAAGLDVVGESLDGIANAASMAADQEPEQLVGVLRTDQLVASQPSDAGLEDTGLESGLPTLEVAAVETSLVPTLPGADAGPAIAALDLASDAAAASDVEAAVSVEFVASDLPAVVADTPASMAVSQESEQIVGSVIADQSAAPQRSDSGIESELPGMTASEAVAAQASPLTALLDSDAEPAVPSLDLAISDLLPDATAVARQAGASDVEFPASLDVAPRELSDEFVAAPTLLAAELEPEHIVGALVADQPTALPLSDTGVESELPAMTAFEAGEAESSLTTALLDVAPDEMADVLQDATFDGEVAAGPEVVANESLHGGVDAAASMHADEEPVSVVGALLEDQSSAPLLSDAPLESGLPAFEAAAVEASLAATWPAADVGPAVATPRFATDEAAAATHLQAVVSVEFLASESLDDVGSDAQAAIAADQVSEQVVASVQDHGIAPQWSDLGSESESPAMTAFEAESGLLAALLDADAEPPVATSGALPTAVLDVEAASLDVAAGESLDGGVGAAVAGELLVDAATDTAASMAVSQESEQIVGRSIADQTVAPQLSDPDPESELRVMTAFEAIDPEASPARPLLDPDGEPAVTPEVVSEEAAQVPQAAVFDVEASAGLDVAASDSLDSDAELPAPMVADQESEQVGAALLTGELLDDVSNAAVALAADQEPGQVVVAAVAAETTASQWSDASSEPELLAMMAFEAEASSVTALHDAVPDAAALHAAAFDIEPPVDLEVAAGESLDGAAEAAASMVASQESDQASGALLADQPIAPLLSDAGLESEGATSEAVQADSSGVPTLLEADAGPAVAPLDLAPDEVEALPAAVSDVEAAVSVEFVAGELLDDVSIAAAGELAADQEPGQVVVAPVVAEATASQWSDAGSEFELLAMTAFEAVQGESGAAPTWLETAAEPAVATSDLAPDEAANAPTVEADTEVSVSFEFVASELLADVGADTAASPAVEVEPVVDSMANQFAATQPSDAGLQSDSPAMTAFEAADAESSLATARLDADAEPAGAALGLAQDEAAVAPRAAAADGELPASIEVTVSEPPGDVAIDVPASLVAEREPEQVVRALIADQPAPQSSVAAVGSEFTAAMEFEAVDAELSAAVVSSEASGESAVTATLDLDAAATEPATLDVEPAMPNAASAATPAATIETASSVAEALDSEWFDDFIIDVPELGTVQRQLEHGASASISEPTDGVPLQDTTPEADVPVMTALGAGESVGPAPVLSEAGAEIEVIAELELEPAAPSEAFEPRQAAAFEAAVTDDRQGRDSEWFDDFVIDVPALGALQGQLEQAGSLPDEGTDDLTPPAAAAVVPGQSASSTADSPEQAADVARELPAAEVVTGTPTLDAEVAAGLEAPAEAALAEPGVLAVDATLAVEPVVVAVQVGEAAVSLSESDAAAAAAMLELGPAASTTAGAPQVPALEERGDVVGEDAMPLASFAARDFDGGATRTAAELVADDIVGAASVPALSAVATDLSLPEPQPQSMAPPALVQDSAPQVAALSATRDAAPRPEQLRRGSITALLDEYPAGAMQWEPRETNSVESVYEVDVAAFSSPLAFEHYPLKDGSD